MATGHETPQSRVHSDPYSIGRRRLSCDSSQTMCHRINTFYCFDTVVFREGCRRLVS